MNYSYKAYKNDEAIVEDGRTLNEGRKIKDLVTINITIEIEASKYEAKKAKYKNPLSEKVLTLFK